MRRFVGMLGRGLLVGIGLLLAAPDLGGSALAAVVGRLVRRYERRKVRRGRYWRYRP